MKQNTLVIQTNQGYSAYLIYISKNKSKAIYILKNISKKKCTKIVTISTHRKCKNSTVQYQNILNFLQWKWRVRLHA